jgi:hypothetical protein
MTKLCIFWLLAGTACAAVDGVVVNGTTGKPISGAAVVMVKPGGAGMESIGNTVTDAAGRFRFEPRVDGPALVQTLYQGVSYSQVVAQGESATALVLQVHESTTEQGAVKVAQHAFLLSPENKQLVVREHVVYQNGTNRTFNDPDHGSLRIYVPGEGKDTLRVSAMTLNSVPLVRPAIETGERNVFKVVFPLKPGTTAFDVVYAVPFPAGGVFSGKALEEDARVRLVAPPGVSFEGNGVELIGIEPKSQASNYKVMTSAYSVKIARAGEAGSVPGEEDGAPAIEPILPRIYDNVYPILGLTFTILALGMLLLYRRDAGPEKKPLPRAVAAVKPAVASRGARRRARMPTTA